MHGLHLSLLSIVIFLPIGLVVTDRFAPKKDKVETFEGYRYNKFLNNEDSISVEIQNKEKISNMKFTNFFIKQP